LILSKLVAAVSTKNRISVARYELDDGRRSTFDADLVRLCVKVVEKSTGKSASPRRGFEHSSSELYALGCKHRPAGHFLHRPPAPACPLVSQARMGPHQFDPLFVLLYILCKPLPPVIFIESHICDAVPSQSCEGHFVDASPHSFSASSRAIPHLICRVHKRR